MTNLSGARGVSLIFSSGDGGVGDNNPYPATHECFTNDGKNTTRFLPVFPASFVSSLSLSYQKDSTVETQMPIVTQLNLCPSFFTDPCSSVTSVGGTVQIPEVAVSRFFSGGGFSDYVR